MKKSYSTDQIASLIGVTSVTVRDWEARHLIPQATRVGLRRRRIWSQAKAELILRFAQDNGYRLKEEFMS